METVDGANAGFVMVCAFLVLLMTPGLAFFYGGMSRSKNVL
ncbi:MAG: nrgA1, partial [Frankiales bacterium]|nr:nrgA1 [Frankiales bacterium]